MAGPRRGKARGASGRLSRFSCQAVSDTASKGPSVPPPRAARKLLGLAAASFGGHEAVGICLHRVAVSQPGGIDADAAADGGDDMLATDEAVVHHGIDLGRRGAKLRLIIATGAELHHVPADLARQVVAFDNRAD